MAIDVKDPVLVTPKEKDTDKSFSFGGSFRSLAYKEPEPPVNERFSSVQDGLIELANAMAHDVRRHTGPYEALMHPAALDQLTREVERLSRHVTGTPPEYRAGGGLRFASPLGMIDIIADPDRHPQKITLVDVDRARSGDTSAALHFMLAQNGSHQKCLDCGAMMILTPAERRLCQPCAEKRASAAASAAAEHEKKRLARVLEADPAELSDRDLAERFRRRRSKT